MELHEGATTGSPATATWWASLPNADEPGHAPEHVARPAFSQVPSGVSRRRFMQVGMALGGALALNGLQILSGVKLRRAGATVGTEYTTCAGYGSYPGYDNNTLVCVGGPYSYIYCGSDGWFKNGYFDGGNTHYWPTRVCGAGSLENRNAWRWPHGAYRYRCADGYFRYYRSCCGWTSPAFKICSQWIGYA